SISSLLARVRRALISSHPQVRALLTYMNPNLGFTGSSYRADNWALLGKEEGTRDLYVHGNYLTDREVLLRFGESFEQAIGSASASGFTRSKGNLLPLLLYIRGPSTKINPQVLNSPKWLATTRP